MYNWQNSDTTFDYLQAQHGFFYLSRTLRILWCLYLTWNDIINTVLATVKAGILASMVEDYFVVSK
jgi:hypothetical protein